MLDFYEDSGPERVGFVLIDDEVIELENISPEPEKGFVVRPEDLVLYEDRIKATWHTHPGESSNLSVDDYEGFMHWPKLKHYVIGNDGIKCFTVKDGALIEDE